MGLLVPLRATGKIGSLVSASGLSCAGFVSSLLLADHALSGLPASSRSFGRLDAAVFATDFSHLGLASVSRSLSRLGPAVPVLDSLHPASSVPFHSVAQPGSTALVAGMSCAGFVSSLSAIEVATLGTVLLPRCSGCLGLLVPVLAPSHFDPLMASRSLAQLDSPPSSMGLGRSGAVTLAPDLANLGILLPPQSLSHLGSMLPVLRRAQFEAALSIQSPG